MFMQHIESILPENVADELTRFLLDDATISSALKDLLHRDTGCDIPLLDNVPTSDVEEIIPLCLSILRRFWNIPLTALGDGFENKSIAETLRGLIGDRIQYNEEFAIQPANTNIPTAIAALKSQRINDGLVLTLDNGNKISFPDGMSLVQFLCGKSDLISKVTEIIDNNIGWTMTKSLPTNITGSLTKLCLGCSSIDGVLTGLPTTLYDIEFPYLVNFSSNTYTRPLFIYNNHNITELTFPEAKAMDFGFSYDHAHEGSCISTCSNLKKISMPKLERFGVDINGHSAEYSGAYCCLIHTCENLEEVYLPSYTGINNWRIVRQTPNLHKLVLGIISNGVPSLYNSTAYPFESCTNLVHLEIQGCVVSLDLRSWNPTNVLADAELTEQFLTNFQTYIADRVADMTGKGTLTLTLSSAVYTALEAQEGQTILATLANKNWNVAQA